MTDRIRVLLDDNRALGREIDDLEARLSEAEGAITGYLGRADFAESRVAALESQLAERTADLEEAEYLAEAAAQESGEYRKAVIERAEAAEARVGALGCRLVEMEKYAALYEAEYADNLAMQQEADELEARVAELEGALERIGKMAGPGTAGTGAAGWILTLEAPEIARAALASADPELPLDLERVLRDPSIIVPQDQAVFEAVARWKNAPSDTASAEVDQKDRT